MNLKSNRLLYNNFTYRMLKISYHSKYQELKTELPEFIYSGKNIKPHMRLYMVGVTTHGGLGVKQYLRPEQGKRVYKFMHRPHRLNFADETQIEDVACGYGFTVFAARDKSYPFFGTGINTNCQIGKHGPRNESPLGVLIVPTPINLPLSIPTNNKMVACGRAHTFVWTDKEGLWSFGNNSYGQCGRPIDHAEKYGERAKFWRILQFDAKNLQQIECGQDTSFVLCDGIVYSCGWSADGQTGLSTYDNVDSFRPVEGDLKGEIVRKISCKADCVLALTDKGDVFGWGNTEYRQLCSVTEDQQVASPRKLSLDIPGRVIDVAATGTSCLVLTDRGEVWTWGYGILGLGPNSMMSHVPKMIPNTLLGRTILNPQSQVKKLFAGTTMAAAVTGDGGLYTWGRNSGGELGLGHRKHQHFPMRVCVCSSTTKVSCGVDHMAIMGTSLI